MKDNIQQNRLVPELRFAEFVEDGAWEVGSFNDVYSFKITNSFSRDKLNYENGRVKNIHYGDIHTKFSTHFDITKENVPYINSDISLARIDKDNYCKKGDLVIADASEDIDDIGKSIEIVNLNKEKLLAGLHTFLARPIDGKITNGFGGHLFKSTSIRLQIKREAQGAKVLGISKGRLANLKIYYPPTPQEQQKIAATLSSLDDLLQAETERLALLKEHKKGLLQQLFPKQGEKVPQLRFEEFVGDGDWEEKEVGEIFDVTRGYVLSMGLITDTPDKENLFPVYSSQTKNDGLAGYYKEFLYENAITWTTDGANAGDVNYREGKFYCTNVCGVLINKDGFANKCIAALINSVSKNHVSYIGNPKLMNGVMSKIKIPIPTVAEQKKITNIITSVDDIIEAQTVKINTLQAHKKGLMQGMFPNTNTL